MEYRFDDFTLDLDRGELRRGDASVAVEPLAFALLCHLIENAGTLVGKDVLVETVWDGRFITDAAISTVVKSARRALGDDGTRQKYIRTVHGRGFRFVAEVTLRAPAPASAPAQAAVPSPETPQVPSETDPIGAAPTLAIVPFGLIGEPANGQFIADGLPAELITTLTRLRWLKVIARGSSFRFRGPEIDMSQIREALKASYVLTGEVELLGAHLAVSVELVDARSSQVVWAERLSGPLDEVHRLREELVVMIIAALELHLPQHEAQLARLRSPNLLDAWGHYHTGLQHMYRFNKADNALADAYFRRAVDLDPGFARAYGALSFTSFQSAFLRYGGDRQTAISAARDYALRGIDLDPLDPFVNYNLGRSYWLEGTPQNGFGWLEQATALSPHFAHGLYARSWAEVMAGDGAASLEHVTRAIELSPIDPFLYAMLSAKGLAHLQIGDLEQAADWAERGARRPGAHYLIKAISAVACQIVGDTSRAVYWKDQSMAARPDASVAKYFAAFPFQDEDLRGKMREALLSLGFPET